MSSLRLTRDNFKDVPLLIDNLHKSKPLVCNSGRKHWRNTLHGYLDNIFWSAEVKGHTIDCEGDGRQTAYLTAVKYILGMGEGETESEEQREQRGEAESEEKEGAEGKRK